MSSAYTQSRFRCYKDSLKGEALFVMSPVTMIQKYIFFLTIFSFFVCSAHATSQHIGVMDTTYEYYQTPIENTSIPNHFLNIATHSKYLYKSTSYVFKSHFGIELSSYIKDSHIFIPEIYYSNKVLKNSQLQKWGLGRKIFQWSRAEKEWDIAFTHPLYSKNPFQSEMQGLTGFFYALKTFNWTINFLVSPIYIPSQSGTVKVENKSVVPYTRWSTVFFYDHININGQETPIEYKLRDIDHFKILQRENTAFFVEKRSKKNAFKFFYSYKPYNQIYLYITPAAGTTSETPAKVDVNALLSYHHLAFIEWEKRDSTFNPYISLILDRPIKNSLPTQAVFPKISEKLIWSSGVKYSPWHTTLLSLNVLFTQEQKTIQTSEILQEYSAENSFKYRFEEALQVKIKKISKFNDILSTWNIEGIYSLKEKSAMLSLLNTYKFKTFDFYAGFLILGSAQSKGEVNDSSHVITRNVANDMFYTGFKYKF